MIRSILAVVAGLFAGMGVNMVLVLVNGMVLFPMPEGMDMNDPEQLNAYIATLPTAGFVLVLLAHLGQSFFGGWAAARLGSSLPMVLAMIVGVISLALGIINMLPLDFPAWMYIELPLYIVVAWLAGRMEVQRRAAQGR